MEKKRKLPPRAAARAEHASKRRTATPPSRSSRSSRSLTPAPPAPEPAIEEPQLPKSVTAGTPLPTVERPQPDDLSSKVYQSIQESGVLAESLNRSRLKWIQDGIFEKYWTKPTKRKGVVKEEPNNPPKDSMTKIGTVTITVEPHVLEATMYAVKDPKPPAPSTPSAFRPIIQYGPPNGVMPPPPKPPTPSTPSTPSALPASPIQAPTQPPAQAPPQALPQSQSRPATPSQQPLQPPSSQPPVLQRTEPPRTSPATSIPDRPSAASPHAPEPVLAAPSGVPRPPAATHSPMRSPAVTTTQALPTAPMNAAIPQSGITQPKHIQSPAPNPVRSVTPAMTGPSRPPVTGAKAGTPTPAAGADPIIVTLAERASEDPHLRDLMKRVAVGEAAPAELQHFQKIIDQITAEYKRKGGQQGPSADRLLVDGRTVKYFADEVRVILDIVLASNPHQKGRDLRVPPGSDPLVISLVQKALDDIRTKDLVKRVAEGKTRFNDATDLKAVLDRLKATVPKHSPNALQPHATASQPGQTQHAASHAQFSTNGTTVKKPHVNPAVHNAGTATPPSIPQQALRSKGPPPNLKPDISAIVFEFHGGSGDRYLFPKYSILEYQPGGFQVLASFLIVRKGSKSEYGGDPTLDYYQPVTIRVFSHSGRHLENLARVVAPQDEVRRYMDDVMSNMTRAEYVLLAMRLPRADNEETTGEGSETPKSDPRPPQNLAQPGVLWTSSKSMSSMTPTPAGKTLGEDEQYSKFIATVS